MIRNPFVIQMADPCNEWTMTSRPCPVDRLPLRLMAAQYVVGMILDDIVGDRASLWAPLGSSLNVHICHEWSLRRIGPSGLMLQL